MWATVAQLKQDEDSTKVSHDVGVRSAAIELGCVTQVSTTLVDGFRQQDFVFQVCHKVFQESWGFYGINSVPTTSL
jgi:hypothetical protein